MDLAKSNKNLIDPIKLTFDSLVYNQSYKDIIENEVLRQFDKTNSNLIGYFHQNIFEFLSDDWKVSKKGYDIENTKQNIFVEMKNKHNTMNSSSGAKTYMRMQSIIIENRNAQCLLAEVIAKKSQNIPWIVTLEGRKQTANKNIRRVSVDKFYEIVTKDKLAFQKLCKVLPMIIKDVVNDIKVKSKQNTVFDELKNTINRLINEYIFAFI